ncbi:30S ribosomal protein S12 methylthiotransferase RimO [Laribacter hongkongensis]|uniref:Ribosomal protein uS12 methylthiotransferase RimO n=1 Tax=Laribacter hongkongensis TaxID=168471 RepID=A0ABD4SQJ4_9NEIS|nr:30S ribosomal protein S12 methylthiotransferase RimO [Laribacter hongkongensis]MCG9025383.1 30S ribosomal protein S12 methylthiotransferase RimO [Laribacter hongkongensis]MCG9101751.1 30S ribosomal protein S12 methylthiotransferase RimO [Laribacter hongkongensis]MCG9104600.1 30S ribosomal protein S12 methylthiotransferase RimO [Laribacter hongkongensis]MCG9113745.1 30S ribosomal protein S12 methylthiotransferase RimO [Laribacter hongkongensis]MCG9118032.1 30S ribosomal protein S12 methylthi
MTQSTTSPRIGVISLGCPKASVDTEQILTRLRAEGYELSSSYDNADLVVVNTCGFIDDAVAESLDAIGEALKENGKVIVTGCLGAREGGNMVRDVHPSVLAVTGAHATDEVLAHVHAHLPKPHDPFVDLVPGTGVRLTPKHYAYLKISEGCNHRCTFCIIPQLRGDLVSRPVHDVLQEAENLAKGGVRELLVVSQDTSAYGVDLKYRTGFWQGRPIRTRLLELSRELGQMGMWTRLHYVYPYPSVDEIIPLMAEGLVLPYLDIPFQHASQKVLKAMQRPANSENVLARIKKWRDICPDLALRSTFIVGFPGETEDDFQELLGFLEEAQLDRVGCFTYSNVDGAPAKAMDGQIPEEIKQERQARFMEVQARISAARLAAKVGRTLDVIVDEVDSEADGLACRSRYDAPEIDGNVYIDGAGTAQPGDILTVKVVEADEHDLWAERV